MNNKQTILLADDDASVRGMLASELQTNYEVLVAKDGIDAICLYEQHAARVRALVTDLQMPRLNGQLVTEWVHHLNPRLPVIVMSGRLRDTELAELLQNPTVTFLPKPFNPQQLEALLDVALAGRLDEAA